MSVNGMRWRKGMELDSKCMWTMSCTALGEAGLSSQK